MEMNTMNVLLSTQEDAVKFVSTVSKYPFDVDLGEGNCVIDAKSILGVLSIAVGRMMQVKMHTEHPREKTECGHLLSVLIRKTEGIGKIASHFFCFFAIIYADLRPPAEGRREIKKQEKDEKNLCFDYSGI